MGPYQDLPEPVFNSQSEELPDNSEPEDTPPELVPELQFTLPPSLSTSPLRSSSSQVTPPETTRDQESSQDTSNSLSEMMMNSPDSWPIPPSLPVVFTQTSTKNSSRPQRPANHE